MELSAHSRQTTGTKVKRLRLQGITPGVVFSKKSSIGKSDVLNIQVNSKELVKLYKSAGESTLIDLNVDGVKKDVLIKNIQINPLNYKPVHISFYEVDMSQPIEAEIPVNLINEKFCEPVKDGSGILIQVIDAIKIRCLPKFIPPKFEVDVSVLKKVEDNLTVADCIKVDSEKVEILIDETEVVVKVDFAEQKEKVVETASVEDVAVATAKEAKDDEEEATEANKKD